MEKTRLLFVDNLRILLITLVAMIHLSISYGGAGSWYYKEGQADMLSSVILSWHNAMVQAFSMGLFFLIAGYFTPGSYLGFLARYYGTFHIGTGPVWYIETLLIFSIIHALWRALAKTPAPAARDNGRMPGNLAIAITALSVGVITFAVRLWRPLGWGFTPLNLQLSFFPQYVCLFIVGAIAYRYDWFRRIPVATGRLWLCIVIVFIVMVLPVIFVLGGATEDVSPYMGGLHWQCFAYAVWEQFVGIAIIIALLVLFRNRLNRQGKLARTMSASSYTVYIIHPPVVVLVALALRNPTGRARSTFPLCELRSTPFGRDPIHPRASPWNSALRVIRNITLFPLLKFALAALIALPLCFGIGNFIRQLPLARRIL